MNILITGGTGFLGQRLALKCLRLGKLNLDGLPTTDIAKIVLADVSEPAFWHEGLKQHQSIETRFGDISEESWVNSLFDHHYDVVFHLASIVSGQGEQDFDLALKVNLDGTRYLLEGIRSQNTNKNNNARVVFTSSLAAFGGDALPEVVGDVSKLTPQTTYGTTKAIGELLINDYSRKGFLDGRSARLPTVIVRPGKPNLAASSFVSGLFREPLSGQNCRIPVDPEQKMPVISYSSVVGGLIRLAEISAAELGTDRSVGLPAINTTVAEMMAALKKSAGNRHLGEHLIEHDETIAKIVSGWPTQLDNSRALQLGMPLDNSLEAVVQRYIADYLDNATT